MNKYKAGKTNTEQVMKTRRQILAEFDQLIQYLRKREYHLKRRPTDYNETHYLISLSQEFHPLAEIYAKIGPGDDGTVQIKMLGTLLQQRTIRFFEDNIPDEDLRNKLTGCLKSNLPRPSAEKSLQECLQKEADRFKFIKIKVSQ